MTALREAPERRMAAHGEPLPPGLVCIEVGKGCVLLLSEGEYVRAVKRGKASKRGQALRQRTENRR